MRTTSTKWSPGSIPAHTGERCSTNVARHSQWVYPRTYGGTERTDEIVILRQGLSPHIRGNVYDRRQQSTAGGSIPAHTGERDPPPWPRRPLRVYPRTYGGTLISIKLKNILTGLSPHIRGNVTALATHRTQSGSIPAHTGERPFFDTFLCSDRVYPRTYGGTQILRHKNFQAGGLSPHIRGNGRSICAISRSRRSIPAHTGERLALNKLNY